MVMSAECDTECEDNLMAEPKTNVMRLLDKGKVRYASHSYAESGAVSGLEAAAALGMSPEKMYKTLVTVGKSGGHYVFVVPVASELDLKKAAQSVNEKSIEMIKAKDLLPLTGYIHGGCSPIGMKKQFPTTIDAAAANKDAIVFSAGKIGLSVELNLEELKKVLRFVLADVVE